MTNSIDLAFSYDTTGSMASCIGQVRRHIQDTSSFLMKEIPNIRIGLIAHGDYCDGKNTINILDFTSDLKKICDFVKNVPDTHGGDLDECYELSLNKARSLSWTSDNNKAFVLIGDCCPHPVGYVYDRKTNVLDWRNELDLLLKSGVKVYPVQALGRRGSNKFYDEIAEKSKINKLQLNQFETINSLILSVAFDRVGRLPELESAINNSKLKIRFTDGYLNELSGKKVTKVVDKDAVHPSRFQVFYVDKDCAIKDFVEENGLKFKVGRGFYEFTKRVTIQDYKEVIVKDKNGNMYSGDYARKKLGIPVGETVKIGPSSDMIGFIQSTSNNRKLLAGTHFMYEVTD